MLKPARKQKPNPEGRMPLTEHLRELRNRLLKSVIAIVVVTIVALIYYKQIAEFITDPVIDKVGCPPGQTVAEDGDSCARITANGLLAPFTIMLKVSLATGVVVSSPIWLYQLWAFLAPGLHGHEKKYALSFVAAGVPLFLGGAYLAYAILPTSSAALVGLTPDGWDNLFPADEFLDIVTRLVIVFGLAFELPLLLVLLNLGGVLTGQRMLSWWRFMVVGITVFAAVATPTGDPLTMSVLAAPIVVLYFAATGFCLLNDRRRRRANPDAGLSDDEASELDLTPEDVGDVEPVSASRSRSDQVDGNDPAKRHGYDDIT
ncbi:twin-arginine translocase subunit TatC [Streptomyces sp. LX-29]|uniref:twin-arginine translocase subunit TatC n=1 Tax=Streptomyces sp. LX-29 TaxID=2900152 RepID=UPI00240D6B5E|nr:twin-arginine translocase subunit TatC [Streptomyces sp. LX-29]WFB10438.1 twin-arginine translocase subunit TatC [Streptomyces sp. LX-29]